jgi:SAM-dependent methyltransferase
MIAPLKEQDIRPAAIFERYLELSRRDAEVFFRDHSQFVEVACPGCGGDDASEAFTKFGFRYAECRRCKTLFASPRPAREAIDAFYGDSASATYWADVFFPASMESRRERVVAPRVDRILELMRGRNVQLNSVVDVGAGYGIFLDELRRREPAVACAALEPGQKLAEVCRRNGFETLEAPVEDATAWADRADLVVCFEVIEHVFSPFEFAGALARIARPGGWVIVTSLCADGFDIRVLGARSKSVSPPHHLNFMSVAGFSTLMSRAGLQDVEVLTPGRLDVDIVRNAWLEDPSVFAAHPFLTTLLGERDGAAHQDFQAFLAAHRLSSHAWVIARKPA